MKKFTNTTSNSLEKSVKVGSNIPSDAAGLAWFNSPEVSPKNNIVVVDVSETVSENKINEAAEAELMYADELGILRRMDGSSAVSTDDLTISNLFLHKPTVSETLDIESINPEDFGHYYYVSRYFMSGPAGYNLLSLKSLPSQDEMYSLGIKVLDENGKEYVSSLTGKRKYKILLEPYKTDYNSNFTEIPYRIIVILDSQNPYNLRLMYNKIEADENGVVSNQQLRYTESINAVKYFSELVEESFVIDPNYYGSRNFSIKKIDQKYSNLITNKKSITNGYQVLTPSKAIKDYRTYEVFNWRVIAKILRNISTEDIDYGFGLGGEFGATVINTVKAAVIYSGQSMTNVNPYVFYRLENSPFNLTKLFFENPFATENDKSKWDHWKLDINSLGSSNDLSNIDIKQFDILAWSPDSAITAQQAAIVNDFVTNHYGTLLLDLSKCPDASKLNVAGQLNMTNSVQASVVDTVDQATLIDATKNGGWTINDSIFEKDYYSIIGSSKINGVSDKTYKYFSNTSSDNAFVKVGPNSSSVQPVGILLGYQKQSDAVAKGNIIATTYPLLAYCNSIYSISDSDKVVSSNSADEHNGEIATEGAYSSVVEGPFKLLFNSVSYALYCKAHSKKEISTTSSLINFITDWSSSWVMYSDALEEDEKKDFDLISISSSSSVYCRNLTKEISSSSDSLFNYFKIELSKKLTQLQKSIIDEIPIENVKFYIEITNPDVKVVNGSLVSNPSAPEIDIATSYYLHEIDTTNNNSSALSPLRAYTEKYSRSLERLPGLGPHVLMERPVNSSSTRDLISSATGSSSFNSYPFKLKSYYTYYQGSDLPYNFNFSFSGKATYTVSGTYVGQEPVTVPGKPVPVSPNATNINSAIDNYNLLRSTNIADSSNIFPYTGDLDLNGGISAIWKQGSPKNDYVQYIQYTLAANGFYKSAIDGVYGPKTASAVLAFQKKYKLRYEDGKVDSETKWHLALVWLLMKAFQGDKVYNDWKNFMSNEKVREYMTAVENIVLAPNINSGKPYRKTTFTGTPGPNQGSDILFFEVPSNLVTVKGIKIIPDSSLKWKNFTVTAYGYSSSFNVDAAGNPAPLSYDKGEIVNESGQSSEININIGDLPYAQARYMWINIVGGRIAGHGDGEGFGISGIKINGTVTGADTVEYKAVDKPTDVEVEVSFDTVITGISPSSPKSISLTTPREISLTNHSIVSLTYQNITVPVASSGLQIGSAGFDNGQLKVPSFVQNKGSVSLSQLNVYDVTAAGDKTITGDPISFVSSENNINFETSATYYGDNLVKTEEIDLSSGFRLKNTFGQIMPAGKNTINYGDGVLLLCDNEGNPVGIPSYSQIKAVIDSSQYSTLSEEEKDIRYGYFSIYNQLRNFGLKYGFYDVAENKFIGNDLNYIDLYSSYGQPFSRNTSNVFIAICALDADGLSGDNEFYGLNNSSTFLPSVVPLKYLTPIYSVKYKNSTAIKVAAMPHNTSKFDVWEIPVTNGSFAKEVYIRRDIQWHDWKRKYKGQYLLAEYSTIDTPNITWSKVYGHGYYDIIDEYPTIIDSKTIQARRSPIVSWNHPTTYLQSIAGIIKPEIKVYTRETISSDWIEVDYSYIKDINCYTGIITFKSQLVPSNKKLIKVSYTTEDKNLMIKEVNGEPVPLNPLLNADSVTFDKPMYIYIVPKNISKRKNYIEAYLSSKYNQDLYYEKIDDYEYTSYINFTYDSSIFDKKSINYDPFALAIAIIFVTKNPSIEPISLIDLRLRGGGINADVQNSDIIDEIPQVLSYWDTYPADSYAYSKGGYLVVRIPEEVKDNFINSSEIRDVIKSNITAGVVVDIQNLEGEPWS